MALYDFMAHKTLMALYEFCTFVHFLAINNPICSLLHRRRTLSYILRCRVPDF